MERIIKTHPMYGLVSSQILTWCHRDHTMKRVTFLLLKCVLWKSLYFSYYSMETGTIALSGSNKFMVKELQKLATDKWTKLAPAVVHHKLSTCSLSDVNKKDTLFLLCSSPTDFNSSLTISKPEGILQNSQAEASKTVIITNTKKIWEIVTVWRGL